MLKINCEKKWLNELDIPVICKIVLLLFFGLIYVPFANADDVTIFSNHNKNVVQNLEFKTTTFQLTSPMFITKIETYHWNDQKGAPPGKIGIRNVGLWQAKGSPGMHNTPNTYWTVLPNIKLEPGIYAIADSDPATWSQNSGSDGFGFVKVFGRPVNGSTLTTSAQPTTTTPKIDKLGSEWHETEGRFTGVWVRRDNSNVFDAKWNNGAKGILVVELNENKVTINRNDTNGLKITYEGIISPDGKTINGNEWHTGKPGALIGKWFATIVK